MIVLDTHVWVWWLSASVSLSAKVKKLIGEAMTNNAIYISSISAWELVQLTSHGRLHLTMDVTDWIAHSEALPFLNFMPVDNHIAVKSVQLPGPLHQDPADHIIIATALALGAILVTKDDKMTKYPHIKTAW